MTHTDQVTDPVAATSAGKSENGPSLRHHHPPVLAKVADPSLLDHTPALFEPVSLVSALWLESRISADAPGGYREAGEERPLTIRNAIIATRLIRLIGYQFLVMLTKGQEIRILAFFLGSLSRAVLPIAQVWATSRLLDMVQKSFEAGGVDASEVLMIALLSMVLSTAEDGIRHLMRDNDVLVRSHVDTILERSYLATQLSLSIPDLSSPTTSSLMLEAGIFAGGEPRRMKSNGRMMGFPSGGPFDALTSIVRLVTTLISISTQLLVMYSALSAGEVSAIGWSSTILVLLSIAPALLRTIGSFLKASAGNAPRSRARGREREVSEMARDGVIRQELLLFGLKDWLLKRWDTFKLEAEVSKGNDLNGFRMYDMSVNIIEQGVQNSFYVLLALRVLPTFLSLGSIGLYQRTVESLLRSVQSLSRIAGQVFNNIFLIAAYVEFINLPSHPHLLRSTRREETELRDYDSHRLHGGMVMIARNLSFRYPGTSKDVLFDINLTIPAGTSLALVGFNGGGKTTLAKVLMGLYDHQGTLMLNGNPMSSYDPTSLHRRTSCLFQDFCKYPFTLRENVGIGQVDQMGVDGEVRMAIERGGAEGVLEKLGLEGRLSRYGFPSAQSEDVEWIPDIRPDPGGRAAKTAVKNGFLARIMGVLGRSGWGFSLQPNNKNGLTPIGATSPIEKLAADSLAPSSATGIEQSARLSGGQWQRVALSRAFMRASEADLVVFVEPSASLDPKAEALLFAQIHALSHQEGRRCTTTFVSHRFSTTRKADQIAVVEDGTISECGSHAHLMALQGRYFELFNLQKAGFDD